MRRRFSHIERYILAEKTKWKCAICGCDLEDGWHADHVVPVSYGGITNIDNGQALCPACNLKKGDTIQETSMQKLRPWQDDAMLVYRKLRKDADKQDFLFEACPGAGKTRLAIETVRFEEKKRNQKPFVIIVSPTILLRSQWVDEMAMFGYDISEDYKNMREDTNGCSITYQAIKSQTSSLHDIVTSKRAMVIFDEIHHLSDLNVWGVSSKFAFGNASTRIGLTGTPFRSDSRPIEFVTYDPKTDLCIPDYKLSYAEALQYKGDDKMVRSISFPYFEGHMSWVNDSGLVEADFETDLGDKENSQRLLVALDPSKELFQDMFRDANRQLCSIRQNNLPSGKGLVYCIDQNHARRIHEFIEDETGEKAALVISEEDGALDTLKGFKDSNIKWLVSVRQVTEGINIPSAIVAIYATNISTATFFWQVVFRIGRYINNTKEENSIAYMYLPKHKAFIRFAEEILKEVNAYVDSMMPEILTDKDELEWSSEQEYNNKDASFFMPLESTGNLGGHIFHGDYFNIDELSQIKVAVQKSVPEAENWDIVVLAKLAKLFSGVNVSMTITPTQNNIKQEKTYDQKNTDKREQIKLLVSRVSDVLSLKTKTDKAVVIKSVNGYLKQRFGTREKLTLKKLNEVYHFLLEKINDHCWWERVLNVKRWG